MDERLNMELELLCSMYPDQVHIDTKAKEVTYTLESGKFQLRLPDGYLHNALPEILSASAGKTDLRSEMKTRISECPIGEEVLDSIIASFNDLVESFPNQDQNIPAEANTDSSSDATVTIIVWLHHLLNTNKRKQALSPSSASVSGITKPGYPGVLIYSGPSAAVHEHVNELKQLNWQAFQVRLESNERWAFQHGGGVVEVEAMKDVVADIGEENKEVFMEAMRMK